METPNDPGPSSLSVDLLFVGCWTNYLNALNFSF